MHKDHFTATTKKHPSGFKIGDVVVIDEAARINMNSTGNHDIAQILGGKRLTICGFVGGSIVLEGHDNGGIGYFPHRFKHAPSDIPARPAQRGEFILVLKRGGKYQLAETPRTYATEAQAVALAKSMAERHGGSEFVVFQAAASVVSPPPRPRPEPTVTTFAR